MKYLYLVILFLCSVQFAIAQDKPDGPYLEHYDSGELKKEGQYKNNKRIGEWKQYYKNGQVSKEYSYTDGDYNDASISYYENGIVSHKTELEDSIYVNFRYYESGNLEYKRQYKSGYFKSFYESGAKEIEANYFEYELVGLWKKYYENGNLEWLVTYTDDYRNGLYKNYYENGDLKLEGTNIQDKIEGEEKRYLPGNLLEWKGDYSNGFLTNTWIKYDKKENEVEKIKFYEGIPASPEYSDVLKPTKIIEGVIERVPIYPGCGEMLTNKSRKRCMNNKIAKFVAKNFNTYIATTNNITGRQRISVMFKIDKDGNVFDIKTKNKHDFLRFEAFRVISKLPKLEPGSQKGKPVIMPFALPIVFVIQ